MVQLNLFSEVKPDVGSYICMIWEDGDECDCIYDGLDTSILPLPTHWYYISLLTDEDYDIDGV